MVWHEWGEGPTVVLLHGGYGSWTHWIRNIDALAAEHRVIAADLPGLGDSAMPPEPFTPWSLAGILADGLDAMRLQPPFHRADDAGHDPSRAHLQVLTCTRRLMPRLVTPVASNIHGASASFFMVFNAPSNRVRRCAMSACFAAGSVLSEMSYISV